MTNYHPITGTKPRRLVPKLCGADSELGNFMIDDDINAAQSTSANRASRLLLQEMEGLSLNEPSECFQCNCTRCRERREQKEVGESNSPSFSGGIQSLNFPWKTSNYVTSGYGYPGTFNPQDIGRKFISANGGCCYIDLDHLELCLPEVLSAWDHVAAWHAMLKLTRNALTRANDKLPDGSRIEVLVNNSDGLGDSYGSHLNFLLNRTVYNGIFRKVHPLLFLAAYQVSSIIFTGAGKVGSENGAPGVIYQIAQRADFFEKTSSLETTIHRGLVNTRDESLTGTIKDLARLHVIFYDNTLCPGSSLLKVAVMQIILTMIEVGDIDTRLLLDDPVRAVVMYSHDPFLEMRARMADGRNLTAVELQFLFLERAKRFVEQGYCEGIVPRADEIILLWEDTLNKLAKNDFGALLGRLDWILKFYILQKATQDQSIDALAMKMLDHKYSSLDEGSGLFWAFQRAGIVEEVVPPERTEYFVDNAPEDTRAWTRSELIKRFGSQISHMDWEVLRFKGETVSWPVSNQSHVVNLDHPLAFTKEHIAPLLEHADDLESMLTSLQQYSQEYNYKQNEEHQARKAEVTGQLCMPVVIADTAVED